LITLDYLVIWQHQIEYLRIQVNRFSFVLREYSSIDGWVSVVFFSYPRRFRAVRAEEFVLGSNQSQIWVLGSVQLKRYSCMECTSGSPQVQLL